MASVTISTWSDGIADGYLQAPGNRSSVLDNLLLDEFGKPYSRPGVSCFQTRISTSITGNQRVSGIYIGSAPWTVPLLVSGSRAFNLLPTNLWAEILGPANTFAFPGKADTDFESAMQWRGQIIETSQSPALPARIYCSSYPSSPAFKALTLGLPRPAAPTVTSSGGAGSNYIYAFHFYYTFTDYLGTLFAEQGPVVYVDAENIGAPNADSVAITALPTIIQTTYSNYDIANIKLKIFRTLNNGTTFFQLASVAIGTSSYTDSAADSAIQNNQLIYVNGGLKEWTQPPAGAKYLTQTNDTFWFATDNLLAQSIQGAPGACPQEFTQPTAQKIMGLGTRLSFPILFCELSVYAVIGLFDELGNGGYELNSISDTAGCVSNRGIVNIPGGIVWPGNGGFYFTDGNQVTKISCGINKRYAIMADPNMVGAYDPTLNLVTWTVNNPQSPAHYLCSDSMIHLHLNFGILPYSVFTTSNGQGNWFPSSVAYTNSPVTDTRFSNKLLIGERRGYLLVMDPNVYTDVFIDVGATPATFQQKAIIYTWESPGMDLGDDSQQKWVTQLTSELRDETNISCQYASRKDDGGPWASLSEIRTDNALLWEITDCNWDSNAAPTWNSTPIAEGQRGFPAGTLRSTRRQLRLTNSYTQIARSDDYSTATVAAITRLITLDNGALSWPSLCDGYTISFAADGYVARWLIKRVVSPTVIEVFDPYATLASGSTKWQMQGYRKNERLYMLSVSILFDLEGTTQAANRGNGAYVNA